MFVLKLNFVQILSPGIKPIDKIRKSMNLNVLGDLFSPIYKYHPKQ